MKKPNSPLLLPLFTAGIVVALSFTACDNSDEEEGSGSTPSAAVDPSISAVFVDTEPADAVTVIEARKTAKAGDTITVTGKIAGAMTPFTEGFATAVLADVTLETCDLIPGDTCETPWDACCAAPEVIKATRLTIQILGEDDRPISQSLKGVNGLKELDPIVVTGTVAEGSSEENLIVNVSGLFQRKE